MANTSVKPDEGTMWGRFKESSKLGREVGGRAVEGE